MRLRRKMFVVVVAVLVLCAVAALAQINLNANNVNIRTPSTAQGSMTNHYGLLALSGGSQGTSEGWLHAHLVEARTSVHAVSFIHTAGHVHADGPIYGSVKHFIHPHPTDENKIIRYTSIESGEALTVARGVAKTENGEATITLPEHFALVTSPNIPLTVIVTPEGEPVLLYVKEKSREKIVVAMRAPDFAEYKDVEFSYQVTGVRDGFENPEVVLGEDKIDAPFADNEVQRRIAARIEKAREERRRIWREMGIDGGVGVGE